MLSVGLEVSMKKVCKILFILSFGYYLAWICFAILSTYFGSTSGWIAPALSNGEILYGNESFVNVLAMGIVATVVGFWFIPLYQIIYAIVVGISKLTKHFTKRMSKQNL